MHLTFNSSNDAVGTAQSVGPSTRVSLSDPWITRNGTSELLIQSSGPVGSDVIETADRDVYGNQEHPIRFRIGNGGAGYTGILRILCERFIEAHGSDFRIGWVSNHSRHSQVALLADVVQVALTYEPENEEIAIREGWARRACRAFNDHFVLVGPDATIDTSDIFSALRSIAGKNAAPNRSTGEERLTLFHTRGDGSATFCREIGLWQAAGVCIERAGWIKTYALTPYEAIVKAEEERAFLLTDRATFLTAKQDGKIPSLKCHVEGARQLLNPCAALIGTGTESDDSRSCAASFAHWLSSPAAQDIIRNYGRDWQLGKPLFTVAAQEQFSELDRLSGAARSS